MEKHRECTNLERRIIEKILIDPDARQIAAEFIRQNIVVEVKK